jgi:hypothetical protein
MGEVGQLEVEGQLGVDSQMVVEGVKPELLEVREFK